MTFIPYAKQSIDQRDLEAVQEALRAPIITRGPLVENFEKSIAEYCGAAYGVAFNSGSTALSAAYFAANTSPLDRIVTTPNSFVASVNAGMRFGATPVFIDIDRNTGNFDLDQLAVTLKEQKRSRGRTLITPVHFSGIPVDMQKLESLICDPETIVIEDAAHALGSTYSNGKRVGCCEWSQMTVFSFHPAKIITTGEGGMVLTNDENLYRRLKLYRNNGIEKDPASWHAPEDQRFVGYYEVCETTGNFNFTEFQAALGLSQLKKIEQFKHKRQQLVREYHQLTREMPYVRLFPEDSLTAPHLFVMQIDFKAYNTTRAYVMSALEAKGIGSQVHYVPIYKHPFMSGECGDLSQYFPEMETYYSQALSLPLYYDLKSEEINQIVRTLKDILAIERQKKRSRGNSKGPFRKRR